MKIRTGLNWLGYGPIVRSSDDSYESLGFIKDKDFLDQLLKKVSAPWNKFQTSVLRNNQSNVYILEITVDGILFYKKRCGYKYTRSTMERQVLTSHLLCHNAKKIFHRL